MGHKIKGRKEECAHAHTKTKRTSTSVETICKDCGNTINVQAKGHVDKVRRRRNP